MKAKGSPLFSAAKVEWGTPPDLFKDLDREFRFTMDPCPAGGLWDGTWIPWTGQRVFCNPPYGRKTGDWLAKGPEADLAVFLLPARTDTAWFHDHALAAQEIRFFRGRLSFADNHVGPKGRAPFPSMLVIYRKT